LAAGGAPRYPTKFRSSPEAHLSFVAELIKEIHAD
jgi:hypothetical protein